MTEKESREESVILTRFCPFFIPLFCKRSFLAPFSLDLLPDTLVDIWKPFWQLSCKNCERKRPKITKNGHFYRNFDPFLSYFDVFLAKKINFGPHFEFVLGQTPCFLFENSFGALVGQILRKNEENVSFFELFFGDFRRVVRRKITPAHSILVGLTSKMVRMKAGNM